MEVMADLPPDLADAEVADPQWFREPTRREHWIGAAVFIGFGLFFLAMFVILNGWWFRWVIGLLGVVSLLRGVRHVAGALRSPRPGGH
jgi:fatty acid desaturase